MSLNLNLGPPKKKRPKGYEKISANGGSAVENIIGPNGVALLELLKWAILIAILVLVILSFIWDQDTHNLVKDPGTDSKCDDQNQCTKDEFNFGRCENFKLQNGESCESQCFTGETSCQNGQCVGGCPGSCSIANDCPNIKKTGGGFLNKKCERQGCFYTADDGSPPFLQGTCSQGVVTGSIVINKWCRSCIDPTETFRDCVDIHAFCPVILPNQQGPGEIVCNFYFNCTNFEKLLI